MLNEILIPTPKLSELEKQSLANVQDLPYSLEEVEDAYFVGNEIKTDKQVHFLGLDSLIGNSPQDTYLNVQMFIYSRLNK